MDEQKTRNSFLKVKTEITGIEREISQIKTQLSEIVEMISILNKDILTLKNQEKPIKIASTHPEKIPTHPETSTHNSTVPYEIGGLKSQNLGISIRNQGASTDRQTDRQTDKTGEKPIIQQISEATEILDSLDNIKKEIRLKFKRMTNQEMLVFSTIYQLEEQNPDTVDYKTIALKLGLSQSSIRDYVQRIIDKGVPIAKTKVNNKQIILKIPENLRKIASLQTILKLREI